MKYCDMQVIHGGDVLIPKPHRNSPQDHYTTQPNHSVVQGELYCRLHYTNDPKNPQLHYQLHYLPPITTLPTTLPIFIYSYIHICIILHILFYIYKFLFFVTSINN